jgi:S-adenosylmethionine/arginine decarboxylase-like enzyme
MYGKELILDLHDCNTSRFNRGDLSFYLTQVCYEISMVMEDLHFWDYSEDPAGYEHAPPHLKGTSCIQFIRTSNITIHTLDDLRSLYLNLFSCKEFDSDVVAKFTEDYFKGKIVNRKEIDRI